MAMAGVALAMAFAYAAWLYAPICTACISAYRDVHTPPAPPKAAVPVALPSDIVSLANRHVDDWARESVTARARELYEECGDWGMVAHQLEQEGSAE